MSAFRHCFPFRNSLEHELVGVFRESGAEWLEKVRRRTSLADSSHDSDLGLRRLVEVSHALYADLYLAFKFYSPIIEDNVRIQYFQILFKRCDLFLFELFSKVLVDEVVRAFESLRGTVFENNWHVTLYLC